ncbi:DUF58 domain-containing protein [Aestuariibacter halophilus]|uniref:DUF58 domain-containing protein n=1 Tax=Fluctibacter halophilus TaxID=226011 RepID=A0ABS8G5X4_9ALTE|nr:DUF58 domain-containing protein [Aestuariibacter halophilus]MCC2616007.1 DUF58 domain-containing protein [Aestuariibacter halophilus]
MINALQQRLNQHWQARIGRWLDRRIPPARSHQLDHRNIFIFPSRLGGLFLLLCFGLFLLGTNYQNNLMLMLCYFLLALMLVTLFSSYQNFARLQVHLGKTQDCFAGDVAHIAVWLNQPQGDSLPALGIISMRQQPDGEECAVTLTPSSSHGTLSIDAPHRGPLPLKRVTLSCEYPLGLFHCWTHLAFDHDVMVYPRPVPSPVTLHGKPQEGGPNSSTDKAGQDEFHHLREYQRGEPLNHVAWKQVAKGQGMFSKHFVSEQGAPVWLNLMPCTTEQLEQRLGQLCYQIRELTQAQQSFGLDLGKHQITPDCGLDHQRRCLRALAEFQL